MDPNNARDGDNDSDSEADEDFNPDLDTTTLEQAAAPSSSDDEDDPIRHASLKQSKAEQDGQAEHLDIDNSGDEATIKTGRRKKRKIAKGRDDEDEGGEGGLIKTRAQRRAQETEKKPLVNAEMSAVDVDALWAQMSAPTKPPGQEQCQVHAQKSNSSHLNRPAARDDGTDKSAAHDATQETAKHLSSENKANGQGDQDGLVTIVRKYEFAGQVTEEERRVPASSAEARLYFEVQNKQSLSADNASKPGLRRPTKRKSVFDLPPTSSTNNPSSTNGKKLNTLEKSQLDWATHIDREGLTDELEVHSRAKDGYLGKMDFLGRMDAKRQDDYQNRKLG